MREAGRPGLGAAVLVVAALAAGPLASPTCARRLQSCLDRCEFEVLDHHRLLVLAEDVLSFQRFFDPRAVGEALREVTSLEVRCSQALLGETLQPFDPAWAALAPGLLHLELHRCRIMSLAPRALASLASLTSLIVDNQDEGSPFVASEGGLEGLVRLASFRLSHARLGSLDHTLFHSHARHNLIKVFLTHNGLTRIERHALCGMPRLSDLDLSCNKLGVAPLDFLRCAPSLYLLNLSRNALQDLTQASLTHSPTLHTLDLSHNNLSSVVAIVTALNASVSLRQVFLSNNPWHCNRTAMLNLYRLRTGGLRVADWRLLTCRQGRERLLVHEWLFPHAGGGVRAWHVILAVAGVVGGLCCLLALRNRTRHLPLAPWLWPRKVLPRDGEQPAPDSPLSKLPQPPTCLSVLASSEEQSTSPKDPPRKGLVNGISEALIDKVLSELPRPTPLDDEDGRTAASYISYKTQLDPEERHHEERNPAGHLQRQQEQDSPNPGLPVSREADRGERAAIPERDEDVSNETLPLTTSAGVATSPTETQTMSVAGLRGLRQYTVASWLTLEAPQATSRPATRPPTPHDLLAAKMQQKDSSATFRLTRPQLQSPCPAPDTSVTEESLTKVSRSPSRQEEYLPPSPQEQPLTPVGVSESREPLTRQRSAPLQQQQQQQQQEQESPSRPIGQRHQEDGLTSGWAWEAGVCRACLAALSLPDVHSVPLLQHGAPPAWPRGPQTPGLALAPASPRRGRGHAGYSPFTKTPMSNVSERPVYRSLERGTRRRPLPPPPHPRALHQEVPHGSIPFSRHRSPPPAHVPPFVPSVSRFVQQQEQLTHTHKAVLTATRAVPTHSNAVKTPPALPPRQQEVKSIAARPKQTPPEPLASASASGDEAEARSYKREAHPESSRGVGVGGEDDDDTSEGEHCDIDIEAHATQIIDLVELHGQSPCKPS